MPFARNFFNQTERALVEEAIKTAETLTSAEIVVHLDDFCWGNPLKVAAKRFGQLGIHKTAERNGVLIYIAAFNRKLAVLGDEGIYQKLGAKYWEEHAEILISEFKAHRKAEALSALIIELGQKLGQYFPRKADDKNELNNNISM